MTVRTYANRNRHLLIDLLAVYRKHFRDLDPHAHLSNVMRAEHEGGDGGWIYLFEDLSALRVGPDLESESIQELDLQEYWGSLRRILEAESERVERERVDRLAAGAPGDGREPETDGLLGAAVRLRNRLKILLGMPAWVEQAGDLDEDLERLCDRLDREFPGEGE